MRDSFIIYTSYQEQIKLLDMEQRGVLFTAIMNYAGGEELPEMDGVCQMCFSFIRANLDRDADKYDKVCEARREAGSKGGRPKPNGFSEKAKKPNGFSEKAKKPNGFSEKQTKAKKPDNDNEYDNDNDTENESDSKIHILSNKNDTFPYFEIISYLNNQAGTSYRSTSKETRSHIRARFNDGFTEQDFYKVIDKKVAEWKGTDMEKYLRPSTLFGTKFEAYLNQIVTPKDKNPFADIDEWLKHSKEREIDVWRVQ